MRRRAGKKGAGREGQEGVPTIPAPLSACPSMSVIRIVNARQNNLQGITVELPHRALTVITGPSGSGKSTLAFDTLYAEGQRRYIESLSTYAKQFLERMPKPLVDRLEGIAPGGGDRAAESHRDRSRSTVGTATEVYDYLRLLWARVGRSYCRVCGAPVRRDTPQSAADDVVAAVPGRADPGGFPAPAGGPPDPRRRGRRISARSASSASWPTGAAPSRRAAGRRSTSRAPSELLVVVDRLVAEPASAGRLAEAVATAFQEGEGVAVLVRRCPRAPAGSGSPSFPPAAPATPRRPRVTPALFSFNNPRGACASATASARCSSTTSRSIVPDPARSLADGAIDPWTKPRYESRRRLLLDFARSVGADPDKPWHKLQGGAPPRAAARPEGPLRRDLPLPQGSRGETLQAVHPRLPPAVSAGQDLRRCGGSRLNADALAVRIGDDTIACAWPSRSIDGDSTSGCDGCR